MSPKAQVLLYRGCQSCSACLRYILTSIRGVKSTCAQDQHDICILPGTLFAGLQHSDSKCWCGSKLDQNARLDNVSCMTNCSEDLTEGCKHKVEALQIFGTGLPGSIQFFF